MRFILFTTYNILVNLKNVPVGSAANNVPATPALIGESADVTVSDMPETTAALLSAALISTLLIVFTLLIKSNFDCEQFTRIISDYWVSCFSWH